MFRNPNTFKPEARTVNCILMNGGVGDHMASLVAVDYILKNYPWIRLLIWTPDFLLDFAKHILPSTAIIRSYSDMNRHYNRKKTTITTQWDGITSPMKIHLLDYAFMKLCDMNPPLGDKNYLQIDPTRINIQEFNLPKDYVVITTGYTAKVREFRPSHVNNIIKYIKSKGLETVFLGSTQAKMLANNPKAHIIEGKFDEETNYHEGIDLLDRTTLLQAAKIMGGSKAVLGVDNGLLHVAGCTQAPIIGGFTTVSPQVRMPVRHNELGWNFYPIVPEEDLGCRFCQERTGFLYGHKYTDCMYKDNLCTNTMTADKFIKGLEKVFESKE